MTKLRLGVLQMRAGIDPAANAVALVEGITRLAAQGVKIVFTPEMSGVLDRDRSRSTTNITSEVGDLVLSAAREAAARCRVWVQIGSLALTAEDGGKFFNRAFLVSDDGAIAARYDKIHLFDVVLPNGEAYCESAAYQGGETAIVAATPWGPLGLSICYDVRFPKLYNDLALARAVVIAVPAAFTQPTGLAHWHVLLRARAIETGAFIVAAAQSGVHEDGRTTFGHSLVVDPWGKVLLDMGTKIGEAIVDIDLDMVAETRARIPSLVNARPFTSALTPTPVNSSQAIRARSSAG